jgi:hypothetical protein
MSEMTSDSSVQDWSIELDAFCARSDQSDGNVRKCLGNYW